MTVSVHFWSRFNFKNRLHNRFLINDRGGIQFGDGLEITNNDETDQVSILGPEPHMKLLAKLRMPANRTTQQITVVAP